jgi:hypothetical protein
MDWKEVREEILANPRVRAEYDALKAEYQRTRQLIEVAMRERQLAFFRRFSQYCDLEVLASNEMWR